MEKEVLREYLESVRQLEISIYTTDRAIDELRHSKKNGVNRRYIEPPTRLEIPEPRKEDYNTGAITKGKAIGVGAGLLLAGPIGALAGYAISKGKEKKHSNINYDEAMNQYHAAIAENERKYQEALVRYNREIEIEENRCVTEQAKIDRYNRNIDQQIRSVENLQADTRRVLQKLYDLGIIYVKYRSIIPVSRFCEYLDSGRRTELSGTNGMYDLYESEVMSNQIVSGIHLVNNKLDEIGNQLSRMSANMGRIVQNQELIYREIQQSNFRADEICSELKNIADRQEDHYSQMEESAKMTAYSAEVTARNSKVLADIAKYETYRNDEIRSYI